MQSSTSPLRDFVRKRDFYAGGLMLLIGLGIALKGLSYRAGTLMHMGPGFLPTALGVLLAILGITIAVAGLAPSEPGDDQRILPEKPQWRWDWTMRRPFRRVSRRWRVERLQSLLPRGRAVRARRKK